MLRIRCAVRLRDERVAFRKVILPAAGSKRLALTIPAQDLTVWKAGAWTLVPGSYTFATAGGAVRPPPLSAGRRTPGRRRCPGGGPCW
ncbi:fibronectin type III-like domain-contianing protein [Streptomyces sp. NBC_00287]|uniref:fibronectin type III-like domain-contianing protein n=1 Tax=Streptomyces sp. NBC_00287 TaxID=2975702 RepID=UPI002E2A2DA2|nr:fibronectin type III-like domain-contianing protein [Streptomyces sp. NBC_00287]